jgi:methyl-accepting chemotaxis protein
MPHAFSDLRLVYKLLVPLSILIAVIGAILWTARGGIGELNDAFGISRGEARTARLKAVKLAQERVRLPSDEMAQAQRSVTALQERAVGRLYACAAVGPALALGLLAAVVLLLVVRPLGGFTAAMQRLATQASGEVGAAAAQVLGSAGDLSRQSERLKQEMDSFLSTVRAA